MSQLYHEGCKGIIYAAIPLMLQVVTFSMADGKLTPAGTTVRLPTGKVESGAQTVKYFCSRCGKEVDLAKDAYINCPACDKKHTVQESVGSSHTPFLGEACFTTYLKAAALPSNVRKYKLLEAFLSKTIYV